MKFSPAFVAALFFAPSAFAQTSPPADTPAAAPPGDAPVAAPPADPTTATPAQQPAPGLIAPEVTTPVLAPPAEPAPPKKHRFAIVGGIQGGVLYYVEGNPLGTNVEGIPHGLAPGYHLGLRASFEFFSWLALDGRFSVSHDGGTPMVNGGSATSVGGLAAVRFTAPLKHVKPYALVGYGSYHQSVSGAGTRLIPDTSGAYEFAIGATVPTGRNIEVGVEYKYAHLNGEVLTRDDNTSGGDPSMLSLFVQYRLPIL